VTAGCLEAVHRQRPWLASTLGDRVTSCWTLSTQRHSAVWTESGRGTWLAGRPSPPANKTGDETHSEHHPTNDHYTCTTSVSSSFTFTAEIINTIMSNHNQCKQAGWFLRPNCATSSECPQFGMPPHFDRCTSLRRRFNQNIPPSIVLLQQCHCRNQHRGKLQNLSPPSVLFELSPIYLQYTGDTDAKNDEPEF